MNCPICKKTLTFNVVDDRDKDIVLVSINCPDCGEILAAAWPQGENGDVVVAANAGVVTLS